MFFGYTFHQQVKSAQLFKKFYLRCTPLSASSQAKQSKANKHEERPLEYETHVMYLFVFVLALFCFDTLYAGRHPQRSSFIPSPRTDEIIMYVAYSVFPVSTFLMAASLLPHFGLSASIYVH
jgi:hypothetical protein